MLYHKIRKEKRSVQVLKQNQTRKCFLYLKQAGEGNCENTDNA